VAILKMLAVLVVALGMAAVESVRPSPAKDEDDDALFVGSAHALPAKRSQKRAQLG
jgi:protoheme ferro-lyase